MIWDWKSIFNKAGIGAGLADMAVEAIASKINKELEEAVAEARLEKIRDEERVRILRALIDEANIKIKNLQDDLEVAESRKSAAFQDLRARAEHAEWLLKKCGAEME
jgi:hypothetical protein